MINKRILDTAINTKFYGLKGLYTHKISLKNKKCGDYIVVELITKKKIILLMRYETESCIFCQASASMLANKIKFFSFKNIDEIITIFNQSIKDKKKKLPSKFKDFKFIVNNSHINRYDCIMLPFNALKRALKNKN